MSKPDEPLSADAIEEAAEDMLEHAPCAFIAARMDGTIIKVNAKLLEWTGSSRDELLEKVTFQQLLPKGDRIYFETHIRPLLLMNHYVKEIACHLVREGSANPLPVFLNASIKTDKKNKPTMMRITLFDATDRVKYEEELRVRRRQADQLAAIVSSSNDAIVSTGMDLTVRTWNKGAEDLFGYTASEAIGSHIDSLIIPASKVKERDELYKTVSDGRPAHLQDTERCKKDGTLIPVELRASPIFDSDGQISGISVIFTDITERRRAEEHTKTVLAELNHRTKNLMSVIQSIARLSGKGSDLDSFLSDFNARLAGIAANQDLLVSAQWHSVGLDNLVRRHIEPFCQDPDTQLILKGPPVEILPDAAQGIGMALHELATNAVKYGALGVPEGQVFVTWSAKSRFKLEWKETNGPEVKPPLRTGFGSTVLSAIVEGSTQGRAETSYETDGLRWRLVTEAASVMQARRSADARLAPKVS